MLLEDAWNLEPGSQTIAAGSATLERLAYAACRLLSIAAISARLRVMEASSSFCSFAASSSSVMGRIWMEPFSYSTLMVEPMEKPRASSHFPSIWIFGTVVIPLCGYRVVYATLMFFDFIGCCLLFPFLCAVSLAEKGRFIKPERWEKEDKKGAENGAGSWKRSTKME